MGAGGAGISGHNTGISGVIGGQGSQFGSKSQNGKETHRGTHDLLCLFVCLFVCFLAGVFSYYFCLWLLVGRKRGGGGGGLKLCFLLGAEAENHHVPIQMNGFF